jgi:tRNA wybutosine-synthesizing protein 1
MSESDTAEETSANERNPKRSDDGPKQVSSPNYHSENHTAAQTCGWTANALRGEEKCFSRR